MTHDIVNEFQTMQSLVESGQPFVCVTLAQARGSFPQIVGAKAVVTSEGLVWGTVGGGKIEAHVIEHARQLLHDQGTRCDLQKWNLQTDIGMTCGGESTFLFDVYRPTGWSIAVFGAGHIAQSLIPILVRLDAQIVCVDSRPEWIERLPRHPRLRTICIDDPRDALASCPDETFFVLVGKGHATDLPVLADILRKRDAPYVGVIGSRQKAAILKRELERLDLPKDKIDSFHCPMGLPLGNNTPIEIAISIAAQLLEIRDRQPR